MVASAAGGEEEIVYADIDLNFLDAVRHEMPLTSQRRNDMYKTMRMALRENLI